MLLSQLITGIAHIGIRVHTLERARAFYELLGFNFVIGPIGPEPVAIMSHPSGIEINFILNAADTSTQNVLMDVKERLLLMNGYRIDFSPSRRASRQDGKPVRSSQHRPCC